MKMRTCSYSFRFIREKSKKRMIVASVIIALSFFVMNVGIQLVLLNINNVKKNMMDNKGLMLIQMFGQSQENQTCIIDIAPAETIDHVVFATEDVALNISLLNADGTSVEDYYISLNRIDPKYSQYFGITNMEEGIIYLPFDVDDACMQYQLAEPYDKVAVTLKKSDWEAPAILRGEEFASFDTYEQFRTLSPEPDEYFATPCYLIGVDNTKNVYEVVKALYNKYPNYDLRLFYQADGMERLIYTSGTVLYWEIGFLFVLVVTSCCIVTSLLSSILNSMAKEMMIMHLHGLSRRELERQFLKLLFHTVRPFFIGSCLCSVLIFLWHLFGTFHQEIGLVHFIVVEVVSFLVAIIVIMWVKFIIKKKISHNTSNDNISAMLRN